MNRTIARILNIAIAIAAMFCPIASAELEEKDFTPEFVAQCKAKAEAGDAKGQALYGIALLEGWGVASNHVAAVRLFRKAAERGFPKAQRWLGRCFENGLGVKKDAEKAKEWLRKAAEAGDAEAQYAIGFDYYVQGLFSETTDKALAKKEAVKWYLRAAEQGFVKAYTQLALCYLIGQGVDKDFGKAFDWYRKAADAGDSFALRKIGECYENGTGVDTDEVTAFEWYEKAANKGDHESQLAIAEFYRFGKVVKEDKSKAMEWYNKAAQAGNAYAQLQLGKCYLFGIGTLKDESNAVKWLTHAAEQGQGEAYFILSKCYSLGMGVEREVEKSSYMSGMAVKTWLKRKDISAESLFNLGWCFHFGIGIDKDIEKASSFFEKAVALSKDFCKCKRELELLSTKLGIIDHVFLFAILQEYTCAENALNNLARAPRPFDNEALAGALLCWSDNYIFGAPTSWTTIDGRTFSGQWETCDESGRILHICDADGYVELYVGALCEEDKNFVETKMSEFRNNAEYVWKDGYWITKTNLKGIEKAINLINSKSPRGPQHLEIFQITGDYSALALTWKFSLFESPAPPPSPQWPEIEVSAVLVKGNKGSAIVNGQLLDVGNSTFNGAVLRAVAPSSATFEWHGERRDFPVVARRKKMNTQPKPINPLLSEKELICLTGQNLGAMYAEGEKVNFTNLFWASTYTYETKGGDSKTVGMFTPSFDRAILLVRKALGLFDKTDPILGNWRPGAASPNTESPSYNARGEKPKANSFGSGFSISSDGFFLTNFHVVKAASKINILFGESKYQANCIDYDADLDIAILKIDTKGKGLPFLSFSSRRIANLGEDVYAIGFPRPNLQGASIKVTKGVISSLRGIMDDPHCYQIDASLQPGNSGGPVVDAMGNVVGVSVAQLKGTEAMRNSGDIPQNVNYAIKSSCVMAFLDSTPECVYRTDNRAVKPQTSSSGISENVTKACGLVIAYE